MNDMITTTDCVWIFRYPVWMYFNSCIASVRFYFCSFWIVVGNFFGSGKSI